MGIRQEVAFKNNSAAFKRLATIADVASLTPDQRRIYDADVKYVRDTLNQIRTAYNDGSEIGFEKGFKEGREEGLEEGLEKGLKEGLKKGREEGRKKGREEGREEGRKEGLEEGLEKGLEKGLMKAKFEMAKKCLDSGMDPTMISTFTGLSIEEINSL